MGAKRIRRFKYDLSLWGLLVFIVINVWLSLVIKKLKKESSENDMLLKQEQKEAIRANQHIKAFTGVFCMNMGLSGAKLNKPSRYELQSLQTGEGVMLVLNLKAFSCNECNMHVVDWLVKRNAGLDDFRIVAHTSNTFYLDEMYHEGVLTDPSIILWYDDELYDAHISESTADLLFIDRQHVIQALFPLDLINDACLLDQYLQCADAAFDRFPRLSVTESDSNP